MLRVGKSLVFGAAMLFPSVIPLQAADIFHPPIVDEPAPPPVAEPCCAATGFYLRGDVGIDVLNDGDFSNDLVTNSAGSFLHGEIGESAFIGIGIGYEVNKWFRVEATAEFRGSQSVDALDEYQFDCGAAGISSGSCSGGGVITRNNVWDVELQSNVYMINGFIDFDLGCSVLCGLTPYIGGGVGYAYHTLSGTEFDPGDLGGGSASYEDSDSSFAYNLQLGVAYDVSDNLTMELGYRYLDLGDASSGDFISLPGGAQNVGPLEIDGITSQQIKLGMRWRLGGGNSRHHAAPSKSYF